MENITKENGQLEPRSSDDSRLSARRKFKRIRWPFTRNITLLVIIILSSSLLVNFLLPSETYPIVLKNALIILLIAAFLWITEAIPPFAVSFLIMGLSVFFLGSLTPMEITPEWEKYVGTWSSPVIWILLGGFMLAIGAQITKFDLKFSQFVIGSFGNQPYRLILGVMLTTGILSMFISNTATTAMMITIVMPLVRMYGPYEPFVKAMLLGISSSATFGGMGTVIGSSPNAIALGILQSEGYDFSFVDWMIAGVPAALVLIFISWLLLKYMFKSSLTHVELKSPTEDEIISYSDRNTTENRIVVVLTFIVTISLWMTSTIHNIPVAVISLIPVVTFTAAGIVRTEEIRLIPWDTLILVSGGLTLGIVINDSGLASFFVEMIPDFQHYIAVILFLAFITSLVSNIMSNTAAASILIPLSTALVPGEYVMFIVVAVGFAASTSLILPISTPPNALVYSTKYLNQSDFRIFGIIITCISPFLVTGLLFLAL